MNNTFIQFHHQEYSIVIDDNGRVVYGYFLKNKEIVGDIWLLNHNTPNHPEWKNKKKMPFRNSQEYVDLEAHRLAFPLFQTEEWSVVWEETRSIAIEAKIFIANQMIAKVAAGSRPGWSTLVKKDGPLAKIYPE